MSSDTSEPADQSEQVDCPTCGKPCKNRHGMRIHHATAHDESLVPEETAVCQHCGDEFVVPDGSTGKYCSNECNAAGLRNRVTLECEHCGLAFEAEAKVAEKGRKYCSHSCYSKGLEDQRKRNCAACGRQFSVYPSAGIEHCSRACWAESRSSAPRPDDVDGLLWLLYVYEGHNARETWLRANANLDPDDQLTQEVAKQRLRDNGWMKPGGRPKYGDLTIEDVGLGESDAPGDSTWRKYYDRPAADGGES